MIGANETAEEKATRMKAHDALVGQITTVIQGVPPNLASCAMLDALATLMVEAAQGNRETVDGLRRVADATLGAFIDVGVMQYQVQGGGVR